jgi:YggT family protein
MRELIFIVDTLFALVVGAFLLRLLCQIVRTDFRNPLVQAIVRLTNPLVMPLRRVLPPFGRVDSASVVAVLLAQMLRTTLVLLLAGDGLPSVVELLDTTLLVFLGAIFLYVILSWVSPDGYTPAGRLLADLVEPLLRPFRRLVPPLGGLDLSPLAVILLLSVLRMVLNGRLAPLLGV